MSKRDELKSLLKNKASLISTGRGNGTSYTNSERGLAKTCAAAVLTATGIADVGDDVTDEVVDALQVAAEEAGDQASVPSLCRAVYRSIEKERLADDSTATDFPKQKGGTRVGRDHTSLGLLFRKAMKDLGVAEDIIDQAFPSPYKGKGKQAG